MPAEQTRISTKPTRPGSKRVSGTGTSLSTRGAEVTPLIAIDSPPARQRKTPISLTGLDEDAILARIENGESIAVIAASLGADRSTLSKWLNADDHRSARALAARSAAAAAFDEQAEQELRAATDLFQLAKAREIAQHLRWRASKINPKAYGDRMAVEPAEKPETLAEALKRLNDMPVPPHASMPSSAETWPSSAELEPRTPPAILATPASTPIEPMAWRATRSRR